MKDEKWDIRLEGHPWEDNALDRYSLFPEKVELIQGQLCWTEEQRIRALALFLENVGAARAVQLGPPEVWREAVARLDEPGRS